MTLLPACFLIAFRPGEVGDINVCQQLRNLLAYSIQIARAGYNPITLFINVCPLASFGEESVLVLLCSSSPRR